MDLSHWVLLLWAAVIFYATGQIWFAQLVVYPLFAKVGTDEYVDYHRSYGRRIPLPVIVPGFAAMLLPALLLFLRPPGVPSWLVLANLACGLVGLAVTVALEIPRHARLERGGKQDEVIRELIRYNWPRTASLTVSAALTVGMLATVLGARS